MHDYLDSQRIAQRHPGQGIKDHTITCLSELCTLVTVNKHTFLTHYKGNESFSKDSINELVWNATPRLLEFGHVLRNRIAE